MGGDGGMEGIEKKWCYISISGGCPYSLVQSTKAGYRKRMSAMTPYFVLRSG